MAKGKKGKSAAGKNVESSDAETTVDAPDLTDVKKKKKKKKGGKKKS